MNTQHTPTPWSADDSAVWSRDRLIADCETAALMGGSSEANAAFIVRACNAHQFYTDALELIAAGIADPAGIARAALAKAAA